MTTRLITAVAMLALAAGCGGDSSTADSDATDAPSSEPSATQSTASASTEPTDVAVQAEVDTCYTQSDKDGPDYSTAVDCSQPHAAEVFLVLDMPADLISEDRSAYEDGGELDEDWSVWGDAGCGTALQELSGLSVYADAFQVESPGYVAPGFYGSWSYSLTPPDEWAAGQYKTVCTARTFEDTAERPQPEPSGQWVPTLTTAARDITLSSCDSGVGTYVPCDKQHYNELIAFYNAGNVPELSGLLNTVNPDKVTDAEYAQLDPFCDDAVQKLGDDRFKGLAYPRVGSWGVGEGALKVYVVDCFASVKDRELEVLGSILAPETLEFVPID